MGSVLVEVCLDSVESAVRSEAAGARRVELCSALLEGGLTPSAGCIALCRKKVKIPIHVMIRPRGGDFVYSENEIAQMKYDIELCKSLGIDGIVLGLLNDDGTIDKVRTKKLVEVAKPMAVTFHRAFDMTKDPFQALEDLIEIGGIQRILTSGQESTAIEGIDLINDLVVRASGRITIMPGGGINERNISKFIKKIPSLREIHVYADTKHQSSMKFKNDNVYMGFGLFAPEYQLSITSEQRVREFINKVNIN